MVKSGMVIGVIESDRTDFLGVDFAEDFSLKAKVSREVNVSKELTLLPLPKCCSDAWTEPGGPRDGDC